MKKIIYNTPGAALIPGTHGGTNLDPVSVAVELPFSPENLRQAEAEASPGSLLIRESSEDEATADVLDRLVLKDRAADRLYELYVENGKLMMEVI